MNTNFNDWINKFYDYWLEPKSFNEDNFIGNIRASKNGRGTNKSIEFPIKKLEEIFNEYNFENFEIYSKDKKKYEIGVNFNHIIYKNNNDEINVDDRFYLKLEVPYLELIFKIDKLTYKLSKFSTPYSINYITLEMDKENERIRLSLDKLPLKLLKPSLLNIDYEENIKWEEVLEKKFEGEWSLKIISDNEIELEDFRKYRDSFIFDFMKKYDVPIGIRSRIEDSNGIYQIKIKENSEIEIKDYNKILVKDYEEGLRNTSIKEKFMSFYNVIEYFYPENLGERLSIKCLLDDINIDDLKNILGTKLSEYYENNNVTFLENNTTINWSDTSTISNRIYDIRNALVHTKEAKPRYEREKHDKDLEKEIHLVQIVAQLLIDKKSSFISIENLVVENSENKE